VLQVRGEIGVGACVLREWLWCVCVASVVQCCKGCDVVWCVYGGFVYGGFVFIRARCLHIFVFPERQSGFSTCVLTVWLWRVCLVQ